MKKAACICLFIFVGALCFAASEDLEMYTYLYDNSQTHEDQLKLLQTMAESNISDAGEFYGNAIKRLIEEFRNVRNSNERLYAENQAILLASLVGKEKHTDAAEDLWRIYDAFSDSLVKAEVLMSLGQMNAEHYLQSVIKVLNDLNETPPSDRLNGERVAFGAIIGLEKYGDISGYLPVYFASQAWYTERVKNQALKSLQVISSDPSEPMIEVIQGAGYNYATKFAALRVINAADVSRESKSKAALAAFEEAWRASSSDSGQQALLRQIRVLSMEMLRANGCSDNSVYRLLELSYKQYAEQRSGDQYETYNAISTLSVLATDDAAKLLASFLNRLNDNQRRGSSDPNKDNDLVRRIIPALGATKQASARRDLMEVNTLGWSDAVKRLAQQALNQLK